MRNCQFCQTKLQPDARFCHHCGAKILQAKHHYHCAQCLQQNPADAQYCVNCGSAIGEIPTEQEYIEDSYTLRFPLDFRNVKDLGGTLRQYFVVELDKRIQTTHNSNNKEAYLNHLMRSDFQEIFKLRTDQLAEEAYTIHSRQQPNTNQKIDAMLSTSFEGLLDFFFIKYCKDINEVPIPEATLKYEGTQFQEVNLFQMVKDYLELEKEAFTFYTDFLKMPLHKLQNAGRYYLFPDKDEKILVICDQTVFGSCKEGFALTEAALYWKAHFKPAQKVLYKDLEDLQNKGDHLLINGLFFNADKSLNVKMLYLLNRLKRMF